MKFVSIVGARPQFIKMAAFNRALSAHHEIQSVVIHTGQHYDPNMSEIFFQEMEIPVPHYNLNIQHPERDQTITLMRNAIVEVLEIEKPQWVIVFGDTNSTLAGAKAANHCNILLAHIEAGLRSYNNEMPEETNRIETDSLSDLLCAPTKASFDILQKEFFNSDKRIIQTGDIMLDSFKHYIDKPGLTSDIKNLPQSFNLSSLHRKHLIENYDLLSGVVVALNKINELTPVILCAHPRTFQTLQRLSMPITFRIVEPQGYKSMLYLLKHCNLVITDSGGLQKEAYFAEKKCLTIREETEWTELVDAGVNMLAGYQTENIYTKYLMLSGLQKNFDHKFYGEGKAAEIIINAIKDYER